MRLIRYLTTGSRSQLSLRIVSVVIVAIVILLSRGANIPYTPLKSATQSPVTTTTSTVNLSVQTSPTQSVDEASGSSTFAVVKIVDGDTIKVNNRGVTETVRLIGIDTPETVDPRKPVQCFGKEASNTTSNLLKSRIVLLEADASQGDKDKYGRLLRYVFLSDGTNINETLIREGYAYEYTYNLPYKYQAVFKSAQVYARENKRGLWADGVCPLVTPITR